MVVAGDEFKNTQCGNNNAYCQDNEISWLDWDLLKANQDIFTFFQKMITFRKKHPVVRKEIGTSSLGFPSVRLHGVTPWEPDVSHASRMLGVLLTGIK